MNHNKLMVASILGYLSSKNMSTSLLLDTCQAEHWKCSVWIGGAWSAESEFIWSKSGNRITFTQWSHGEPSGGNEDCMEMFAATGKWNDKKCDYNTSFICEKHIN